MYKILDATFKNGIIIPDKKTDLKGLPAKIKIIVMTAEKTKKEKFLDFVSAIKPSENIEYKFNRDDLHDR